MAASVWKKVSVRRDVMDTAMARFRLSHGEEEAIPESQLTEKALLAYKPELLLRAETVRDWAKQAKEISGFADVVFLTDKAEGALLMVSTKSGKKAATVIGEDLTEAEIELIAVVSGVPLQTWQEWADGFGEDEEGSK